MLPINDLTRGIARSDEAAEAISRVLRSGNWIHGPEHAAFENEFAQFLEVDHVLGVASGTDALEIALRAVGCSRGSKIISVANAGGYTSIAAASIGCDVVYCDVDIEKLVMDPVALKPLLSKDISAVVVTHLYGNIAPILEIKDMCDVYGIPVIEDCAQAAGGLEGKHRVGSIGDIGTFSFYPTKNLGAIGDGGALSTRNPNLAKLISNLRQYGWNSKYDIQIPGGMNSRLDEIQAAVLRIGLRSLDESNHIRRSVIAKYQEALVNSECRLATSCLPGNVAHLAVLLLPENRDRSQFMLELTKLDVSSQVHYPILDHNQIVKFARSESQALNNAEKTNSRILTIPLFPELSTSETEHVVKSLKSLLI